MNICERDVNQLQNELEINYLSGIFEFAIFV